MIRALPCFARLVEESSAKFSGIQGITTSLLRDSSLGVGCYHQDNSLSYSHNRFTQVKALHTSNRNQIKLDPPSKWLKYNEVVYPPTKEGEPERPAEVCHQRAHVKYQLDKMLYLCRMIRGMSVDEAKKQLPFKQRVGAQILKELIEEAQDMAVEDHNVEYRSNMWIAEVYPVKAGFVKGMRKHARMYKSEVKYRYIHLFLKLREGEPPEHYYAPKLTGHEHKANYIVDMRKRRIYNSL